LIGHIVKIFFFLLIITYALLLLLGGIFNWKKVLNNLLYGKAEGFLLIFGWTAYRVYCIIGGISILMFFVNMYFMTTH